MKIFLNIIIITILIFSIYSYAYTEEEDQGPNVSVTISPTRPLLDTVFTLTMFIDYPVAEEVNIITPMYPEALTVERFIKTPRMTDTGFQTIAEYRFYVNSGGRISLGPFEVTTPIGITVIGPFIFNIQNDAESNITTPRMFWEGAPAQMTAGERVSFTLNAAGWSLQQPPPGFFMPQVPRSVILSQSPITPADRTNGVLLRLTLIPLEAGDFVLPVRVLQYENTRFNIPALRIRITNSVR